ncbi:MAG: HAMP domain-containing sensor histidine kinase [Ferruginibacter sp.]|nr:HAMP domain-containing histidine kinase [Ferruginibacter sp.]
MKIKKLNIALWLGFIVIVGIMILQFLLLRQAYNYEEKKFAQKVHVALLEVSGKLNVESNTALPQTNPIEKKSNNYYVVNVNSKFEEASLDYYLKNEFEKFDIGADFEYGYYDCTKECMKYGKYISEENNSKKNKTNFALAKNGMAYYFAVHFPNLDKYIYKALHIWIIFSLVMLIVLMLYGYSAFTILQQKKYSELQNDFINNMTHEFKTPISSILIASNFLDKQEPILLNDKLKKYTELITQQAVKLNNHVEKILNLAKADNNKISLQKTSIHVVNSVQLVVDNILLKYPNAVIKINNNADVSIFADEFHFSNLVYNLLDNAAKYASTNPIILIKIEKQKKFVQLIFTDNGIGIPIKEQQHIFEKFYRIKNIKSNEVNGFGLGLFYVKRICKEHNWNITLHSKIQEGTTIKILIPTHD